MRRGASVGGISVVVYSSLIADADAVTVVVCAVGTDLALRTAIMERAVAGDIVVIADVLETTVLDMISTAVLKAQATPWGSS